MRKWARTTASDAITHHTQGVQWGQTLREVTGDTLRSGSAK